MLFRKGIIIWLAVSWLALSSCTPSSVRDAQRVVAQADSLWREGKMYGVDGGDSATLAHAYHTLSSSIILPSLQGEDEGRLLSCYHYGRLLRVKDNPVEAMQVFIDATHTRTRDYHILGRVYSNMGSICHLAGDFPLSYDMYEKSANMFLKNGDTLNYYYALNDMAFELAMLSDTSFIHITKKIENECSDKGVNAKILETKAEAYYRIKQYDLALLYANELINKYGNYPLGLLVKAQIFSNCEQKDSAVHYANLVLLYSNDISNTHNALYILTNDDSTKDIIAIRETAAKRSDLQKSLEIRHGKVSQAMQLLGHDLNNKKDLKWLYFVLAIFVIIVMFVGMYIYKKHRKRILLSQQVGDLENKNKKRTKEMLELIEEHCSLLRTSPNLKEDLYWKDYDKMCATIDKQFNMLSTKIFNIHALNEKSFRLCILTLLNVDRKTISEMLPYALNSVGKLKDETAKSLGTTGKNLRIFLLELTLKK
ncbi:MAG: hypothetical protein IJ204_06895 [Paludibacteraceae bacterium]|nr:hypothetical protein [Paludibacteraceae bacterium]